MSSEHQNTTIVFAPSKTIRSIHKISLKPETAFIRLQTHDGLDLICRFPKIHQEKWRLCGNRILCNSCLSFEALRTPLFNRSFWCIISMFDLPNRIQGFKNWIPDYYNTNLNDSGNPNWLWVKKKYNPWNNILIIVNTHSCYKLCLISKVFAKQRRNGFSLTVWRIEFPASVLSYTQWPDVKIDLKELKIQIIEIFQIIKW